MKISYRFFNKSEKLATKQEVDIFRLIYEGNLIVVRDAIKNGEIHIHHRNNSGQTLLHWAILYNQVEIVKELIALGAKLDIPDNNGQTARDVINLDYPEMVDLVAHISNTNFTKSYNEDVYNTQSTSLLGCISDTCLLL